MALVLEKHIAQTEGVRGGKPVIRDTRIAVADIVIWHFRQGLSLDEIAVKYKLSLAAVYAAVSFYYDHKKTIDADIAAEETFYETNRQQAASILREKLADADDE